MKEIQKKAKKHPSFDKIEELIVKYNKCKDDDVNRFSIRSYLLGFASVDRKSDISLYIYQAIGK